MKKGISFRYNLGLKTIFHAENKQTCHLFAIFAIRDK